MSSSEPTGANKIDAAKQLDEARKMAAQNVDFRVFHNHFLSQGSPLLANLTKDQRARFLRSRVYKELARLQMSLGVSQGYLVEEKGTGGVVEKDYSGEFRLRVPVSLHRQLSAEARVEGVSLNQLCVAKLARPMSQKA